MVTTFPEQQARLLEEFPALADYARTAVRLHPRPGSPKPADSSVGGPLLWPGDEPWPTCAEPHVGRRKAARAAQAGQASREQRDLEVTRRAAEVARLEALGPAVPEGILRASRESLARAEAAPHAEPQPIAPEAVQAPEPTVMVPILQIYRRDVPQLPFAGTDDLLQLLWCPEQHEATRAPRPQVFWRRSADVVDPLVAAPGPNRFYDLGYVPNPCVIHPESVPEFPPISTLSPDDADYKPFGVLPAALETRIRLWSARQPERYGYPSIAHAPGWKLLGWETSGPDADRSTSCSCGRPADLLLDAFRSEDLGGPWQPQGGTEFVWGDPANWEDQEPTEVDIAPDGTFQIWLCSYSAQHPPVIGIS
ncbi:MAG TPA: hypothetical protein VFA06_04455 [Actinocrinis sp.]|uniref:hypothetical protein n=1 Tax=Actinocrinis sp. TaxID=1920516 RepID=UPI002D274998|nr:hypothetical protein [Actinocrinis sp.]HZU55096.1 hypothetical protein [Actinocrinis sp.]